MNGPSVKKKMSRYARPSPPVMVRLTPRREALLSTALEYRVINREIVQLRHYTVGGRSVAQRDLTLAWQGGLLGKVPGRIPNACDIYMVSAAARRGLRYLEGLFGSAEVRQRLRRPAALEHGLAVNNARARVEVSAAALGLQVTRWLDEIDLEGLAAKGLIPDAFFEIARDNDLGTRKRSGFCLEVEVDPVSRQHWQRRLAAYEGFYRSGEYERTFGLRSFRLLVVTKRSAGQIQSILEDAADLDLRLVRVADWQTVKGAEPTVLLTSPIWRRPGNDEPVALFDLGSQSRIQEA